MDKLASDLKGLHDPDSGNPVKECGGGVMGFTYVSEYDYQWSTVTLCPWSIVCLPSPSQSLSANWLCTVIRTTVLARCRLSLSANLRCDPYQVLTHQLAYPHPSGWPDMGLEDRSAW